MTLLFVLLNLAGCAVLYLSHRNQGWLAQSLAPRWRLAGVALLGGSLACALAEFSGLTATFAWLVLQMLALSLLPFVTLVLRKGGNEA